MAAGKKLTEKSGEDISPVSLDTGRSVIPPWFLTHLRHLITETRFAVAVTVDAVITWFYKRVRLQKLQKNLRLERAGYSEPHLHALSAKLTTAYAGRVFFPFADNLFLSEFSGCIRPPLSPYQNFYRAYPHIVGSLHPQLQDRLKRKGIIPENDRGTRGTYIKTGCPFEVRA
jgi:hypothetical protein